MSDDEIDRLIGMIPQAERSKLLEKALSDVDNELTTLRQQLAEKEKRLKEANEILSKYEDRYFSAHQELVEKKRQLATLQKENAELKRVIEYRNEVENKAHALFTDEFSNGVRLAHWPEQCNPLGFVRVMRAAIEKLLRGEQLPNPFIHKPDETEKESGV